MAIDAAALCKLIDGAFGVMPYPGDEHIVYDNSGSHLECAGIKSALKGHHWRDVSFDALDHLREALSFLSPEGFRFYLPAFMVISIADFYRADVIPDGVIHKLTPPRVSDIEESRARAEHFAKTIPDAATFSPEEWQRTMGPVEEAYRSGESARLFAARVSGFSPEQGKVIRQYLEYMRDVYGAEFSAGGPQKAIDRYWHQF
jgi:hypothetical protein